MLRYETSETPSTNALNKCTQQIPQQMPSTVTLRTRKKSASFCFFVFLSSSVFFLPLTRLSPAQACARHREYGSELRLWRSEVRLLDSSLWKVGVIWGKRKSRNIREWRKGTRGSWGERDGSSGKGVDVHAKAGEITSNGKFNYSLKLEVAS